VETVHQSYVTFIYTTLILDILEDIKEDLLLVIGRGSSLGGMQLRVRLNDCLVAGSFFLFDIVSFK